MKTTQHVPVCELTQSRPVRGDLVECVGAPDFDVVTYSQRGDVRERIPCCFGHGLIEIDRHHAAAGMARRELVEHPAEVPA